MSERLPRSEFILRERMCVSFILSRHTHCSYVNHSQELVAKLLSKLDVYIKDGDKKHAAFRKAVQADIKDKLQVPGGATMLDTIGYVYKQEAVKFSGGFLGIGGFFEGAREV